MNSVNIQDVFLFFLLRFKALSTIYFCLMSEIFIPTPQSLYVEGRKSKLACSFCTLCSPCLREKYLSILIYSLSTILISDNYLMRKTNMSANSIEVGWWQNREEGRKKMYPLKKTCTNLWHFIRKFPIKDCGTKNFKETMVIFFIKCKDRHKKRLFFLYTGSQFFG